MKTFNVLMKITKFGLACLLAVTLFAGIAEAKKVRWKMQSAYGAKLPHLGPPALRFVDDVKVMSDGELDIKFFEPNALVPAMEIFEAVSKGSIDCGWTSAGFHVGKIPALSFFTAVPFGPGFGEYRAWYLFGGGRELHQELLAEHNLISFWNIGLGPETSGWFRKEIASPKELRGLKMRFFGLGAKVMQKMGVSTQLLSGGDIYPALEKGVIDATEFSMPNMDIAYGFYQIAKYNYFPGWHSQIAFTEVLFNKKKFEALTKAQQRIIKVAAGHQVQYTYAETEAMNFEAMHKMVKEHDVKIKRWPDSTLKLFEQAWVDVVKEESDNDPIFKKVADSYFGFRKNYKIWKEAQALKATYLDE